MEHHGPALASRSTGIGATLRRLAAPVVATLAAFVPTRSSAAAVDAEPFEPAPEHPVTLVHASVDRQVAIEPEPGPGTGSDVQVEVDGLGPAIATSSIMVEMAQPGSTLWQMAEAAVVGHGFDPTAANVAAVVDEIIEMSQASDSQGTRRFDVRLNDGVVTRNLADPDLLHPGDVVQVPTSVATILEARGLIPPPGPAGIGITG